MSIAVKQVRGLARSLFLVAVAAGAVGHSAPLATNDGLSIDLDAEGRMQSVSVAGAAVRGDAEPGGFWLHDWRDGTRRRVPMSLRDSGQGLHLSGRLAEAGLALEATATAHERFIRFEGRLLDLSRRDDDRAVDVILRVPFSPGGQVRWWPDILGPLVPKLATAPAAQFGLAQSSLAFAPVKATRLRLYQPALGGCAQRPKVLWLAELEAYGRDQNTNLMRAAALRTVTADSTADTYSLTPLTDGLRNDAWDPKWTRRGWVSAESDGAHWVEAQFAEPVEVCRVDLYWCRERFGFATSQQFRLEYWDGERWQRIKAEVSAEAPRLGDGEKAAFTTAVAETFTEHYPFACVTSESGDSGVALALPPDSPCVFRLEYDQEAQALQLALKFGLSRRPRKPELRSQAPFSFVLYRVDGRWGCRDAAQRYYQLRPAFFKRVAKLDGLWMLGAPTGIPNPHHYAYREHGEKEADLDDIYGLYTCPYVLVGQREFITETTDGEQAVAELRALDPSLRSFYGPGLKEVIENCSLRTREGKHIIWFRRRGGSIDGPAVATFPMNPDPSLFEGTEYRTAGRETLGRVADILRQYPNVDGIYVDSLASWGGYQNARREHFAFADLPLTHDKTGQVIIDNALAHLEFLEALRDLMPSRDTVIFGNGIRKGRAWAGFRCDVLGVEANRSVHRDAQHYAYFRTVAYHKPFLLLYYHDYPKMDLPAEAVSEYVQSAIAFGIAPETRPFGKERQRDLGLYETFIPILRYLGQAGWEPVTHATVDDPAVWLERFGEGGENGAFFTVYNPAAVPKLVTVTADLTALPWLAAKPVRERVTGRVLPAAAEFALDLPAKSLRVLQFGDAPEPPAPPVLSATDVREMLVSQREKCGVESGGLLTNGGFEEVRADGRPSGWRVAVSDKVELHLVSDAHSGERCVYVRDGDAEAYADIAQPFPYVQAGYEYVLCAWVRQAPDAPDPGRIYFQWRGEQGKIAQGRLLLPRSAQWTRGQWRMKPPDGAHMLSLSIGCSRQESTELWLDDVTLTRERVAEKSAPAGPDGEH